MRSAVIRKLLALLSELEHEEMSEFIDLLEHDHTRRLLIQALNDLRGLAIEKKTLKRDSHPESIAREHRTSPKIQKTKGTPTSVKQDQSSPLPPKDRFVDLLRDRAHFRNLREIQEALLTTFGKDLELRISPKDSRDRVIQQAWKAINEIESSKRYEKLAEFFKRYNGGDGDDYDRLFKILSRG